MRHIYVFECESCGATQATARIDSSELRHWAACLKFGCLTGTMWPRRRNLRERISSWRTAA